MIFPVIPLRAKVILQALKTYGAIVSTNNGAGKPVTVIGSPDTRWDYTDLNTLSRVSLSNFEAVDSSSLMIDPNSAKAKTPPVVTSASSITVITPNDGESWVRGSTNRIAWTSSGSVGSYVKIELLKAGAVVQTILSSTPNDGSYSSWTIPTGLATGTDLPDSSIKYRPIRR